MFSEKTKTEIVGEQTCGISWQMHSQSVCWGPDHNTHPCGKNDVLIVLMYVVDYFAGPEAKLSI